MRWRSTCRIRRVTGSRAISLITARVEAPTGLKLFDVGEDYAVALWKDRLEVEYVRVYDLVK